jgi:RnfABCDGE-type electron transport complex B subunit
VAAAPRCRCAGRRRQGHAEGAAKPAAKPPRKAAAARDNPGGAARRPRPPPPPTPLDAALPQTQCTRCGYPDCRGYAEAIASGEAAINRCPPGGAEGILRLAALTGQAGAATGSRLRPRRPARLAVIDEAWCIGCTLCIKACPVDCILGASKRMHTVIDQPCTGCELCLPACPVDCIAHGAGQRHGHRLAGLGTGAFGRRRSDAWWAHGC